MRIPCPLTDNKRIHFLTDYYAIDRFKLEMVNFINSCENGFLKFYNKPKVQQKGIIILKHFPHHHTSTCFSYMQYKCTFALYCILLAWSEDDFSALWPGWDRTIKLTGAKHKHEINSIGGFAQIAHLILTFITQDYCMRGRLALDLKEVA